MLSQKDIQKYFMPQITITTNHPQYKVHGLWHDIRQIVASTVIIEDKEKSMDNLTLGTIVDIVSYKKNPTNYQDILSTNGKSLKDTINFHYICEFDLPSDKILAFIRLNTQKTNTHKIYTIYVCETLEEVIYEKQNENGEIERRPAGFNNHGASRVWGFYTDKLNAIEALHFNLTDLNETCYQYACIEAFEEGISKPIPSETQWFQYDRIINGYFEIDTPLLEKRVCRRAMG